jgi:hypothetical protein
MREALNDHRHVRLSEIFKEKECIEAILGDFDVDCVLDEETHVNVMIERTWELLGKLAMVPSLGGIGLFRGKLDNPVWKARSDTYECQWNFDRRRF